MKRKVTYVITKSNWGGAQRYVFDLATNLPKQDFDVSVILGGDGALAQKLQEQKTSVYRSLSMQRDVSMFADIKSFFELYRLFKQIRPDVVHLNSSKAGGIGALAARMAGVKNIIFTVHGLPEDEPRGAFARWLIKIATRLTFALCDTVITVSNDNQRRVHGRLLIYNGVGPIVFGTGDTIRSAFPPGVTITGTIGELNKNKNQQALIEEAKRTPNMFVAIVGEGEMRGELERLINKYNLNNRVKLFGFLPAAEVLKGFDVFALPSLKEGLPYVLLEAKQAGLAIVATQVGGIPDILDAKDLSDFSLQTMVQKTSALY